MENHIHPVLALLDVSNSPPERNNPAEKSLSINIPVVHSPWMGYMEKGRGNWRERGNADRNFGNRDLPLDGQAVEHRNLTMIGDHYFIQGS